MDTRTWNPPLLEEASVLPGMSLRGLSLRPWTPADSDAHFEPVHASRPEIGRWLGWCHPGYGRADTGAWLATRPTAWAAGTDFAFAIIDEVEERIVGGCGLNEINRLHRMANLGYWVRTDSTGRGVASTATLILARFGFVHLALERIEIVAAVGNTASQRAAEKAGARREGVLRRRLRIHDTSHDAVIYSLVPADLGL